MPHINRVRVNNVKYNFGTQFYDDFMMRFSCKNTIYDLANGGGKSVLMLLLLQNLIPNCTLDEKQPVEKLFRSPNGSTTIHSLIEWKLDSCYQRENFKYMTTGFCARKGKDNGEEELRDTASIEYFNYCIFYREFGDNDIKNLPLSKDGERITYNGLKSYLRDLEKKDHGVEVHIFDRKGDYQNFISQYGLFESEWEIVRGINKTEGHVRTYFENNYKTGRKVVEDLLIEEIIQKSFRNQIGSDTGEEGMARTLLDIKSRIIELSRRKEEINAFDRQIALMQELADKIDGFTDYETHKEELKDSLIEKLSVCRGLIQKVINERTKDEEMVALFEENLIQEEKQIAIAKTLDDRKELEKLKSLVEEFSGKIDSLIHEEEDLLKQKAKAECIDVYEELVKYEGLKEEIVLSLDNRMRDDKELYDEIHNLAGEARILTVQLQDNYKDRIAVLEKEADAHRENYENASKAFEESKLLMATAQGAEKSVSETIVKREDSLKKLLAEAGLLVADQADSELEKLSNDLNGYKDSLKSYEKHKENLNDEYERVQDDISKLYSHNSILEHEIARCANETESVIDKDKLNSLALVYGESEKTRLTNKIYDMYKNSLRQIAEAEIEERSMREYVQNLSEGRYMLDGEQYRKVEEYLFNTYGEDVMYGYQWYQTLNAAVQRDIAKRVPFLDYSFVIKGDFERIKADINLRNISHSSYVVPVISEMITRDTRHAASADYIVFGTKDLSFLMDAGSVAAEIDKVNNEVYALSDAIKKLRLKQDVIWEDYLYMVRVKNTLLANNDKQIEKLKDQLADGKREYESLKAQKENVHNQIVDLDEKIESSKAFIKKLEDKKTFLEKIIDSYDEIRQLYMAKKKAGEDAEKYWHMQEEYEPVTRRNQIKYEETKSTLASIREASDKLDVQWREIFGAYYMPEISVSLSGKTYDQVLLRFNGLTAALNDENSDINDKKTLIAAYEENIVKCVRTIEKAGFDRDELAKELSEKGRDFWMDTQKSILLKVTDIKSRIANMRNENEAQNAQMNRMEGSLSHAINAIEEKYGSYEAFECNNPREYIGEHTGVVKSIKDQIKDFASKIKAKDKLSSEYELTQRELERTLKNASATDTDGIVAKADANEAELDGVNEIQKEFDRLIKTEYRKREEFLRDKRGVVDKLKEVGAFDLADEVERSINVPESAYEVNEMKNNISETCECIVLEKERVGKGIDDMERIKDSFENRCIQICCNIKSELDRLPKLSKITLDNEVISMIGLNIPYVKEEFYKERMSAYINDTVSLSESFKSDEERMNYIKNRLSWKKMFSVIVTDMNGIRLNLYKRERIKDQSRYLRYEEAVGSTGQSQGIYIQFLIAIINYISNINAAGKEVSAIGKVVFIDNPFGAAKDIYIWEPIFKLLKTNHVQLIVPARGATPAITGRFDVNYILGQKLVGSRQQTVVVDYRSQVQNDEMEYTRLEYSQESLF